MYSTNSAPASGSQKKKKSLGKKNRFNKCMKNEMNKRAHGQLGNCSSKHTAAIQVSGSFDTEMKLLKKIKHLHKPAQAGGLIEWLSQWRFR
jgi:hypothetical protein